MPRTFQVTGGVIPADAVAVTGNVAIANQTAGGYLSVTPTANANPLSSTINFPVGDTRANNLTVPLSADGKLAAVYKAPAGRTTHLIVDITGYFLAGDEDATYSTLPPVRVLDSRFGTGLSGPFTPNNPRTLSIAGANGIPAAAKAITGNLTVVGQTRAGYLSITPDPDANPDTSTLNFPLGDTRANGVSVPLNLNGDLSIVYKASGGTTHVILDVTGFYLDDPSGLLFYPLTPGRVMDTRNVPLSGLSGPFNSNGPRRLDIGGHWGAPLGAQAVTGNLTVVNQTAAGYVSATLNSESNPTTSVLNFPLGDTRANGATLPLNAGGRSWFVYKAPGARRPTSSSTSPATSTSRRGEATPRNQNGPPSRRAVRFRPFPILAGRHVARTRRGARGPQSAVQPARWGARGRARRSRGQWATRAPSPWPLRSTPRPSPPTAPAIQFGRAASSLNVWARFAALRCASSARESTPAASRGPRTPSRRR